MELNNTNRGFRVGKFIDSSGVKCSIQESSRSGGYIWLGVDNPSIIVFDQDEKERHISTALPDNCIANSRMHLSIKNVKELLPMLQQFVETGELP